MLWRDYNIGTSYGARVYLVHASPVYPVVLAFKTSTGKVTDPDKLEYYIERYEREKIEVFERWFRNSINGFPSILEHMHFTFFLDGISRIVSHQLVRHRHVSFIQESLRYSGNRVLSMVFGEWEWRHVDKKRYSVLAEGWYKAFKELSYRRKAEILDLAFVVMKDGNSIFPERVLDSVAYSVKEYISLLGEGYSLEEARYVLPMSIRTRITMTGNLRGIISLIEARTSLGAQPETREVAFAIKELIEEYFWKEHGLGIDLPGGSNE